MPERRWVTCPDCGSRRWVCSERDVRRCRGCAAAAKDWTPVVEAVAASNARRTGLPRNLTPEVREVLRENGRRRKGRKFGPNQTTPAERARRAQRMRDLHARGIISPPNKARTS